MKKLTVVLLAVVSTSCSCVFAQDRNSDRPELTSMSDQNNKINPKEATVASVSVPEGQMRGMVHFHTLYSDGYSSVPTSAMWAQRYGAEFLLVADHAHGLALTRATLDVFGGIIAPWTGKLAVTGEKYLTNVYGDGRQTAIPVGPWLEVGEESHFLVFPGSHDNVLGRISEIVDLGSRTKELGTQSVIERIDQILQQTGGCMIQAHPMNGSYPFNYNFAQCQSPVGVEFFNGTKAEFLTTFDRFAKVQARSAKPGIATAGVDQHIPEGALGELEGLLGKGALSSALKGQLDEVRSYRPNKRFTYVFGHSSDATVISSLIRDGHCYAAYGDTVITDTNVQPGSTVHLPEGDICYIKTRGLPKSVKYMRIAYLDDQSGDVTVQEVPWTDDYTGTRTASFSVHKLRQNPSHSGKLIMGTTEFVTSGVIVAANGVVASRGKNNPIQTSASTPVASPAASQPPASRPSTALPSTTSQAGTSKSGFVKASPSNINWANYAHVEWFRAFYGTDPGKSTPETDKVTIGYNDDGRCMIQIIFDIGQPVIEAELLLNRREPDGLGGEYVYGEVPIGSFRAVAWDYHIITCPADAKLTVYAFPANDINKAHASVSITPAHIVLPSPPYSSGEEYDGWHPSPPR